MRVCTSRLVVFTTTGRILRKTAKVKLKRGAESHASHFFFRYYLSEHIRYVHSAAKAAVLAAVAVDVQQSYNTATPRDLAIWRMPLRDIRNVCILAFLIVL